MISIRTVNLIWQKKHRGIYAPSPYSIVDDAGTLALVTPRPLEPRVYDFTLHKPDGCVDVRWGYSAETLMKMEVSSSEDCIGMTADDLYLFRNKNKSRFLTDKHINYIDAALSADGQRVAAAFSDLAGASFAIAYGDISGRLIWLQEFDSPISVVAISRDGTRVAAGLESGALSLLDQERRDVWTFELEAPVRSVACSADASKVAYALEVGAIGLIGADGARIWDADIGGSAVAMALSSDGGLCGVLAGQPYDSAGAVKIYCFLQDGSEGWQHDTERKSTGISLSPNGCFMAVGARDGTISFFGILPGDEAGGYTRPSDTVLVQANSLLAANEPAKACAILKSALAANAADLALYEEYIKIKSSWHASALGGAKQAMQEDDARSAIRALAALLDEDPLCTQAAELLSEARVARAKQLLEEAERRESANDLEGAEQSLRESAAVAPMSMSEPRSKLAAYLARCAETTDARAELQMQNGDIEGALNALAAAQCLCPKPERALRIQGLNTDVEFAAGMKAYNEKHYVQAVFQFKKVLRLDKNHADAQRHLEFAKRFSQDSSTDSLQDRFSRLE
jgi:tetratricopeptide (TPR) repeat protein